MYARLGASDDVPAAKDDENIPLVIQHPPNTTVRLGETGTGSCCSTRCSVFWCALRETACAKYLLGFMVITIAVLALWGLIALNMHLMQVGVLPGYDPQEKTPALMGFVWVLPEVLVVVLSWASVIGVVFAVKHVQKRLRQYQEQQRQPNV